MIPRLNSSVPGRIITESFELVRSENVRKSPGECH